jgi:hypothetical protein
MFFRKGLFALVSFGLLYFSMLYHNLYWLNLGIGISQASKVGCPRYCPYVFKQTVI